MFVIKVALAAFFSLSVTACSGAVIVKPTYATPVQVAENAQYASLYLECGDLQATKYAVSMLTLNQLRDPDRAVRFTSGLPEKCRAGNVTAQGTLQGVSYVQTLDGWVVRVVEWIQSNRYQITFVDTAGAYIGRAPLPYYAQPVYPRNSTGLDVDEGQALLREQLRRLKRQ